MSSFLKELPAGLRDAMMERMHLGAVMASIVAISYYAIYLYPDWRYFTWQFWVYWICVGFVVSVVDILLGIWRKSIKRRRKKQ